YSKEELAAMSPKEFRGIVRRGEWGERSEGACRNYVVSNLAIVPKDYAFEFLLFCNRNPRPCPVIDVTEPGDPHPKLVAPEADLRTDLPKYRVFKDGQVIDEPIDITNYWRDDLVAFLLGCSHSFDWALRAANIHYRKIGAHTTTIPCLPAGRFHGPMQVSCRLVKSYDASRAVQISSRYPFAHGAPVHIGDPAAIGIKDLYKPDRPKPLKKPITPLEPDEVAMFWGCGVTPQIVAVEAKVSFMITHFPGHMFITDRLLEELTAT
ncbi:unnamed protein product, partial [marine sediment metagenome]